MVYRNFFLYVVLTGEDPSKCSVEYSHAVRIHARTNMIYLSSQTSGSLPLFSFCCIRLTLSYPTQFSAPNSTTSHCSPSHVGCLCIIDADRCKRRTACCTTRKFTQVSKWKQLQRQDLDTVGVVMATVTLPDVSIEEKVRVIAPISVCLLGDMSLWRFTIIANVHLKLHTSLQF